jgi:hypothetical protein
MNVCVVCRNVKRREQVQRQNWERSSENKISDEVFKILLDLTLSAAL